MNKKRILKLADYMEKVEPEKYRQYSWLSGILANEDTAVGRRLAGTRNTRFEIKEGACNTAACVLGHAVTAIPEAKLFWVIDDHMRGLHTEGTQIDSESVSIGMMKDGELLDAFDAAATAFGITREDAEVMFGSGVLNMMFYGELNPVAVAKALREFVATNGSNLEEARLGYFHRASFWSGMSSGT